MRMHWEALKYLLRHKWFVYQACGEVNRRCPELGRISVARRVFHDWSKFLPAEWFPYAKYFYGPNTCGSKGFHDPNDAPAWFNAAWLHHIHLQPHHWQHWLLPVDATHVVAQEMPLTYVAEMLADWRGAGMAQGRVHKTALSEWYESHKAGLNLHPTTRRVVETTIKRLCNAPETEYLGERKAA